MEESIKQLWTFCLWYAGISATVTLGLFKWLLEINKKVSVGVVIETEVKKVAESVQNIEKALIGGFHEKGLITRHYDLEGRVEELEKNS